MSTLGRNRRSGNWTARKVIPAVFRPAYAAAFGRSWEEKFFQPATVDERFARIAHAEWLAAIEARLAIIAAEARGDGVDLSHRHRRAIFGAFSCLCDGLNAATSSLARSNHSPFFRLSANLRCQ